MPEVKNRCLKLADDTLSGKIPLDTANVVQDTLYTAVADDAQQNRAHENGLRDERLQKEIKAMDEALPED